MGDSHAQVQRVEVTRPMYSVDAELDLMCSLVKLIEENFRDITDPDEIARATQWLAKRYSNGGSTDGE